MLSWSWICGRSCIEDRNHLFFLCSFTKLKDMDNLWPQIQLAGFSWLECNSPKREELKNCTLWISLLVNYIPPEWRQNKAILALRDYILKTSLLLVIMKDVKYFQCFNFESCAVLYCKWRMNVSLICKVSDLV